MRIALRRQLGSHLINVDFTGQADGITALFGPSGAGKSSIINMIAGLLRPDAGHVSIRGRCLFDSARGINLPPEKRQIGYVFQDGLLFPHLSVKSNLLYGRRNKNTSSTKVSFSQVVELLGLEELLSRRPKTLSGGEKQRVAFGRAVLSLPDILLMDEPLASLDTARKQEVLPFIKELNRRFTIPIVYVSHALEEIQALTEHIIKLEQGSVL